MMRTTGMRNPGFIMCFLFSHWLHATHVSLSLQKALDLNMVEASSKSLGGYQGFCINMTLKNLTKDSLVITIEPGRRLNSVNDGDQDILIVKQEVVAFRSQEQKNITLKGYCCQLTHHSPAKNAKYNLHTLADSNLVGLSRYLNKNSFPQEAEQEAVWALSDGRPAANITAADDSLVNDLREKVAFIKGEPIPWYAIQSKKIVYPNGAIVFVNLRLTGKLHYVNDTETFATLSVVNESGLPVCQITNEWLRTSTGADYKLDLPIKGLAKGKYTVELKTPEKSLVRKDFEI